MQGSSVRHATRWFPAVSLLVGAVLLAMAMSFGVAPPTRAGTTPAATDERAVVEPAAVVVFEPVESAATIESTIEAAGTRSACEIRAALVRARGDVRHHEALERKGFISAEVLDDAERVLRRAEAAATDLPAEACPAPVG